MVDRLYVKCGGRSVAMIRHRKNNLLIEMAGGRKFVLRPPRDMVFSLFSVPVIQVGWSESIDETLRKAGVQPISNDDASSLKKMAAEYRLAAAKLAMSIKEHEAAGDLPKFQISKLRATLNEIRAVARILSGYYDLPRPAGRFTLVNMPVRRGKND